jgi:excisionase family DNA binding protein
MTTFLTSHEVEAMISIDRSTVYRMAEDGRLPGIKVGRQWRFPADGIAAVLGVPSAALAPARNTTRDTTAAPRLDELLDAEVAQSIADLIGDALGTMAVITDMKGRPLTAVANPCGFYALIADHPAAAELCLSEWRQFADATHVAPRFIRTQLGFLCARSFVWVDLAPVGMILAGGVRPPMWPPPPDTIDEIADTFGVPAARVADVADDVWDLDPEQRRRALRLLPQFGDLVSHLASGRRHPAVPGHTVLENTVLEHTGLARPTRLPSPEPST